MAESDSEGAGYRGPEITLLSLRVALVHAHCCDLSGVIISNQSRNRAPASARTEGAKNSWTGSGWAM